jgi:integrase
MAGIHLLHDKKLPALPDGFHADGGNLYLRVRGNGRSWVFRYKVPKSAKWLLDDPAAWGKPVEHGLGPYPDLTLASARKLAGLLRSDIAEGINPKLRLKPEAEAKAKTFKEYAAELIASKETGWRNGKHQAQWPSTLETYVYPHIGNKRPAAIKVGDVEAILTAPVETGDTVAPLWASKTETATRVRQRIEAVIDYAFVKEGIDRRNPARWKGNLEHLLAKPAKVRAASGREVRHHPAPPYADARTIMAKLRAKDATSAMCLRFSVLTAARSGEARAAEWREIEGLDGPSPLWRVPAGRMKGGVEHLQPLAAEAVAILKAMAERKRLAIEANPALAHRDKDKPDRIFAGPTGGLISDVAVAKVLRSIYPDITPHGLARSCFRDWGAEETGYRNDVLEAALAHKEPNKVVAAYRRTDFMKLRTKLMAEWGEFLAGNDDNAQEAGITPQQEAEPIG